MPSVATAALAETLPLTGRAIGEGVRPAEAKQWDYRSGATFLNAVSPGYFATLGIPIVAGRDFASSDRAGSTRVAIVNETLARQFWPGESPLGKRVRAEDGPDGDWEVVGVARDGRYVSFTERPRTFLYRPLAQHETGFGESVLLTRSEPGVSPPFAAVRDVFRSMDPGLPLFRARTLADSIEGQLDDRRQGVFVVTLFGAMALALAAAGLYSVVSYSVARRAREIGIRVALGAPRRTVSALFLRRGAKLAIAGVVIGLVLSAGSTRLLKRMLFGIEATDALTFAGVAALLCAVALLASWIPARRAALVDPIRVLRAD
jgi:predicted permease